MLDSIQFWSWVFLLAYVAAMVVLGLYGLRKVKGSDDFATARGGYGPLFLAFALTATTASGATFLGLPGLGYEYGLAPIWIYALVYPLGVYAGVMLCFKGITRAGARFGSRSIPEALGDRFQSETLRLIVAVFSLILLFYLAGQLVAGLVMFEQMLGLSQGWALLITTVLLTVYVTLGGAHADILTDGIQGLLMLLLALVVVVLFFVGSGNGGFDAMIEHLRHQDEQLLAVPNPDSILFDSFWDILVIFVAHLPLGLLPHIGNKLWALEKGVNHRRFVMLCLVLGMLLTLMSLGGVLARSILGEVLLTSDGGPNSAMPALFIEIFPVWVAALLGVGVLAAVMSTADGLVISTSQVFANDIYRRTLAPILHPNDDAETADRRVLNISRWGTVIVLLGSAALAWSFLELNIALLIWIGLGGLMAATAGPLILGQLWKRATAAGAISGFVSGAAVFIVLRAGGLPAIDQPGGIAVVVQWLDAQQSNSFACAAIGEAFSVATMVLVSLMTSPPPNSHVERVFGDD